MKPEEIESGDQLTVKVLWVKEKPEARYVTVELNGPDLRGPHATFRFNKEGR